MVLMNTFVGQDRDVNTKNRLVDTARGEEGGIN